MEIIGYTLHHGGEPLEPCTGIHRRPWQRKQGTVLLSVELHEDKVPDFQEAACFGTLNECVQRKIFQAQIGPFPRGIGRKRPVVGDLREIHIDLCAWAAGSGIRHLPEVVSCAQAVNAIVGQ